MTQKKTHSAFEAVANVGIGFGVSLLGQLIIFPLLGLNVDFWTNLHIAFWFTILSLTRTYVLRRWFNRVTVRQTKKGCACQT